MVRQPVFRRSRLAIAAACSAAMILPFLFIGDSRSILWMVGSLPLSAWAEERWGIGSDTPLTILSITLANTIVVATIGAAAVSAIRNAFRRTRRC